MTSLALLAAVALSWEGTGTVYPPGAPLKIAVRTRIDADGNVVSESWPVAIGEEKGLRRMTLRVDGGTVERGGKSEPMPQFMWNEERAQFGFYQQLQAASVKAKDVARQGANTFSVPGLVRTWFRVDAEGTITEAVNIVPAEGGQAHQRFRFDGFLIDDGAVFPRHMEMYRGGKPYFTLDVTRFDGG